MAKMSIMDRSGHTTLSWTLADEQATEIARAAFAAKTAEGYLAYEVDPTNPAKAQQVRTFDPKAEDIILSVPIAGG